MKWFQSSKISLVFTGVLSFAVMVPAAEDTWTKKADMPTARNLLSTSVANGKIYAIGGCPGDNTSFSAVEEYDPATDTWTQRASLPEVICGLSTSAIDGKIYALAVQHLYSEQSLQGCTHTTQRQIPGRGKPTCPRQGHSYPRAW